MASPSFRAIALAPSLLALLAGCSATVTTQGGQPDPGDAGPDAPVVHPHGPGDDVDAGDAGDAGDADGGPKTPVAGESCQNPVEALTLVPHLLTTVTRGAPGGSCSAPGDADEVVLHVKTDTPGNYVLAVHPLAIDNGLTTTGGSMVVRGTCDATSELTCAASTSTAGSDLSAKVGFAAPGGVYVTIAGGVFSASGFSFTANPAPDCHADADCAGYATGTHCDATGACVSALVCAPLTGDCDGAEKNGCETDLASNDSACGACGHTCSTSGANMASHCSAGKCVEACTNGALDCDGNGVNGCECTAGFESTGATCDGAKCKQACMDGHGDCNGDPKDGCETETHFDESSCGACGVACTAGQTCVIDTCRTTNQSAAYQTPWGDGASIRDVAADATSLYWIEDSGTCGGTIQSMPLAGGQPTKLVTGLCSPSELVLVGSTIYTFATVPADGGTSRAIEAIPTAGGAAKPVALVASESSQLAADGATLYFRSFDTSYMHVDSVPASGGTPTVVSDYAGSTFAVGPSAIYMTDFSGNVLSVPKTGATYPTTMLTAPEVTAPTRVFVTGGHLYVFDGGQIVDVPLDGGPHAKHPIYPANPSRVLVADGALYYAFSDGGDHETLGKYTIATGAATYLTSFLGESTSIALAPGVLFYGWDFGINQLPR